MVYKYLFVESRGINGTDIEINNWISKEGKEGVG